VSNFAVDQRSAVRAFLGLGANLGDAPAALKAAIQAIAALPATELLAQSALYKTAPLNTDADHVLPGEGADYFNAVVEISTQLSAPDLLAQIQGLEAAARRTRSHRNAPRTLDIDILLYGSSQIHSNALTVPHPRMHQRAFVLMPLAEIAPARVSAAQLASVAGQAIERLPRA
jgi:2-amino-4-hydroxy-6-hydroxymethyldihydropteridine diphosphokinase